MKKSRYIESLEDLGLSEAQASVYFATLALGPQYRTLARLLAKDLSVHLPGVPLVVLTDVAEDFAHSSNQIPS